MMIAMMMGYIYPTEETKVTRSTKEKKEGERKING